MSAEWDRLHELNAVAAQRPIASLFAEADRFGQFSARFDGMLLDYSKTNIDADTRAALRALAGIAGVPTSSLNALFPPTEALRAVQLDGLVSLWHPSRD